MSSTEEQLSINKSASLIGAAGCGKTTAIARAVKLSEGRQLILTHTHAGVRSLRKKLIELRVPDGQYNVETIDSWFLRFCNAYPFCSGVTDFKPDLGKWAEVHNGATMLFNTRVAKMVIQASYKGAFVDEYQDCSMSQHAAILALSELIPVRVVGDPLQGILSFTEGGIVNWENDVIPAFPPLDALQIPWRWHGKNQKLGHWTTKIREQLLRGDNISITTDRFINWIDSKDRYSWSTKQRLINLPGTLIAIEMIPQSARASAKRLGFQAIEDMVCKDLLNWASEYDNLNGIGLAQHLISSIYMCITKGDYLLSVSKAISSGQSEKLLRIKDHHVRDLFIEIIQFKDDEAALELIKSTRENRNIKIHRMELLREMQRALEFKQENKSQTLLEAAQKVRSVTRFSGRWMPLKIVSTPPLIKGLEFDNAFILNADDLEDQKNFYVAATRGANTLGIISSSPSSLFKKNNPI